MAVNPRDMRRRRHANKIEIPKPSAYLQNTVKAVEFDLSSNSLDPLRLPCSVRRVIDADPNMQPVWREETITDNGNLILDVHGLHISDPLAIETRINQMAGVVCNGLFANRPADLLLLGTPAGVEIVTGSTLS